MNRRLVNEFAFKLARIIAGRFGNGLGEEEFRQLFGEWFGICQAALETFCQQEERMQHNLRPMGDQDHVRSNAE